MIKIMGRLTALVSHYFLFSRKMHAGNPGCFGGNDVCRRVSDGCYGSLAEDGEKIKRKVMNPKQLNTGVEETVWKEIEYFARKYKIKKIILFGSRARGDYHKISDIDLAVSGGDIPSFCMDVDEETSTLLFYDIVDLDGVVQKSLRESIRKEGILIYEKI